MLTNQIVVVIAPKGSGKTFKVAQMVQATDRVAVFDLVREQAYNTCKPFNGKPRDFAAHIAPNQNKFQAVYRPTTIEPNKDLVIVPELEPFVKLCYLRGNMTMVIDEAHLICNGRNCPRSLLMSCLVGRHRQLSIIVVAQRFVGIHASLRANADEFWFWRIIEPSDLEGIAERCGNETAEQVAQLRALERNGLTVKPGQCLTWNKLKGAQIDD